MAELSEDQVRDKNIDVAAKAWQSIGGSYGNGENLGELLEKVGPAAYNDFVHSAEYTSTEGQVVEQPVKAAPEDPKPATQQSASSRASGGSTKAGDSEVVIKD